MRLNHGDETTDPSATRPTPNGAAGTLLYRFRFGSAEFDEARFELRVGGLSVELQHKPMRVLALLLRADGQVIDKDRLFDAVWGGRATVEHVLANAISKLRAALGEANAALIVTVPRRGYRIDGPITRQVSGAVASQPLDLHAGAPVPGKPAFTLASRLGRSDGGETWLARHDANGERHVFKFASGPERVATLKREVTVLRLLREALGEQGPVVRIADWQFEAAPCFLQSGWGGPDLLAWAHPEPPAPSPLAALSLPQRLHCFACIADAVAQAHAVGVLHLDLKPANVLIDVDADEFAVRLTDFGSAHLLEPERLDALQITRRGIDESADASGGTHHYLAPELAHGARPSVRSDVYALGILLFQWAVGDFRRPLAAGWERDVADAALRAEITSAADGDPSRRIASAGDLAERVRRVAQRDSADAAEPPADHPATPARPARSRATLAGLLALAVLAVTLSGGWAWSWSARQGNSGADDARFDASLRELYERALRPAVDGHDVASAQTAADGLAEAAAEIDERFASAPVLLRARLHATLQHALSDGGRPGEAAAAGARAAAALAGEPTPAARTLRQRVQLQRVDDLTELGRNDAAAAVLREIAPEDLPVADRARWLLADAALAATPAARRDDFDRARRLLPSLPSGSAERARVTRTLAADDAAGGRADMAITSLRALLAEQRSIGSTAPIELAVTQLELGRALQHRADSAAEGTQTVIEAADRLIDLTGAGDPRGRDAWTSLAAARLETGDARSAYGTWTQLHAALSEQFGAGSSFTLTVLAERGLARQRGGDVAGALALLRQAHEGLSRILDPQAPASQYGRYLLADCLAESGDRTAARGLLAGLEAAALAGLRPRQDWVAKLRDLRARVG